MASKVHLSARLDGELVASVDAYAARRASSRTAVVEAALRAFLDLASGGVPDLPQPGSSSLGSGDAGGVVAPAAGREGFESGRVAAFRRLGG